MANLDHVRFIESLINNVTTLAKSSTDLESLARANLATKDVLDDLFALAQEVVKLLGTSVATITNVNNTFTVDSFAGKPTVSVRFMEDIAKVTTEFENNVTATSLLVSKYDTFYNAAITDETIDTSGKTKAQLDEIILAIRDVPILAGSSTATITNAENFPVISEWVRL